MTNWLRDAQQAAETEQDQADVPQVTAAEIKPEAEAGVLTNKQARVVANDDKLQPLSEQAVRQLYTRQQRKIRQALDKTLPENASPRLRDAMEAHISKRVRARKALKVSELKELAGQGTNAVRRATGKISIPDFNAWQKMRQFFARQGRESALHEALFQGSDRIYVPLKGAKREDVTGANLRVTAWLENAGYSNVDYIAGTCVDDRKNTRKIGRILKADAPEGMFEEFNRDESRTKLDNLVMVISRDPDDVARMSTNRGWASCMANDGVFWSETLKDIRHGSLIAYAVRDTDPDIQDPLARVLIKRYKKNDGSGETIMKASKVYGIQIPALKDQVDKLLDERVNHGKVGRFELDPQVYRDYEDYPRFQVPSVDLPAREFLRQMKIPVESDRDGRLVAKGSINLAAAGLDRLPDLSNVVVEGDFNLASNKLTTLTGAPAKVTGTLNLAGNPLKNFKGAPAQVGRQLILGNSYMGTPYESFAPEQTLETLDGLPQVVGGDVKAYGSGYGYVGAFATTFRVRRHQGEQAQQQRDERARLEREQTRTIVKGGGLEAMRKHGY